ncbi:MAG: PrgI family protein [Candidatus Peregrinibacteria bacterium]
MLQYKIPQNVGIEDKIVGPLTLRQLIIVSVGCGISYTFFTLLGKMYDLNIIEYFVIALPALVAVAAALIRINDIPLPKFVLLGLEYNIKPRRRHWDHQGIAAWIDLGTQEEKSTSQTEVAEKDKRAGLNLNELSRILDSGGFSHVEVKNHPDLDKANDGDLIAEAFFGHKPNETENMYWRSVKRDPRGKRLTLLAKLPTTSIKKVMPAPVSPVMAPIKPAVIKPAPSPVTPLLQSPAPMAKEGQPGSGKKRRRKRKKKNASAHPDTAINAINKAQPVQFVPKPVSQTPAPQEPRKVQPKPNVPSAAATRSSDGQKKTEKKGEFEFTELERGEIEINLD